jgi:predicted PurR-regulated permease PerM
MATRISSGTTIDISTATIAKVLAALVLIWLWLQLWQLLLLFIVAVFLSIALEPAVSWLSRHGVPKGVSAALAGLAVVGAIVGFFGVTGSTLVGQARLLGDRIVGVEQVVLRKLPPGLVHVLPTQVTAPGEGVSMIAGRALNAGRALLSAVVVVALAVVLMMYLLIEGRRTYEWLVAYVPRCHRAKVHRTAIEARRSIIAYVRGNVATSAFAGAFVFIALEVLHVPAALLLALLAAVCDFVPVLGFAVSALPAVLLALIVSAPVALLVLGLYVFYHFVENYYIAPKVYGSELRLSSLAVLIAFAAGAEIAGIVGALLALPIAAMYPVVESIWLRDYLAPEAADEHRSIEQDQPH